jgi:oligopeptidase A
VIDNELRDFKLSGAELPTRRRRASRRSRKELATLTATFDDHVLDATNAYALYVDDAKRLAGLPEDVVAEAREAAQADGREGYKLTVRMPCFLPVMKYAHDRTLRAELHRAQATRASDLGAKAGMGQHADHRARARAEARGGEPPGLPDFAAVSLVPKMARSTDEVLAFLRDLAARAKPYAERDYAELLEFARDRLDLASSSPGTSRTRARSS